MNWLEIIGLLFVIALAVVVISALIFLSLVFLSDYKGQIETFKLDDYSIGRVRHKQNDVLISIEEWKSARAKNAPR